MTKRKISKAEIEAQRARARENTARLLRLAEKAEAELPPDQQRPADVSRSDWLLYLAEKAQRDLDSRKSA
jgi:hypothetical protein